MTVAAVPPEVVEVGDRVVWRGGVVVVVDIEVVRHPPGRFLVVDVGGVGSRHDRRRVYYRPNESVYRVDG